MTSEIIAPKPRAGMQVTRDHSRFVRSSYELKAPSVLAVPPALELTNLSPFSSICAVFVPHLHVI